MLRRGALIFALVAVVAALAYWAGRQTAPEAPPAAQPPAAVDQESPKILLSGVVRAADPVEIHPDTSGVLQSLHVRKGDSVKEGDLLAIVRNDAFDSIEQRLASEYQSLSMRVEQMEKTVAAARVDLARIRSEVESAKARMELARIEASRQKALFDAGATARQTYQRAQEEFDTAQRQSAAAETVAATAESQLQLQERNLASERLMLEDKRAQWEAAQGDVQLGEVLAPVEGVITEIPAVEGTPVSPNGESLIVIAPVESMRFAIIQPSESQMRRIRVGQPAVLRPQALSDVREIPGVVSGFRGAEVLVEFADIERRLPPGTPVQVEIDATGGDIARAVGLSAPFLGGETPTR